jgi:hypothetical protein
MAEEKQKAWNFYQLWHRYPKETNEEVYKKIGGNVEKNKSSFKENLGAVKLSYALNRAGDLIPHQSGNKTVSGYTSDDEKKTNESRKWFFYRKNDLETYVDNSGQSTEKVVVSQGENVRQKFKGKTGIVFFKNHTDDSTGTVTLWDGKEFVKPEHDKSNVAEKTTLYVLK